MSDIPHNSYFDGKVQSLALETPEKQAATVGVMAEGEYRFGTSLPERMEVVSGVLTVLLPGDEEWQTFTAGSGFDVPGDSHFDVKVVSATAYLCLYG